MTTLHQQATAIHAVPVQWLERGFRLLIMRELQTDAKPPAFACIEQHLLRAPQRLTRHGIFFAGTFRPEIMAWLSEQLGRPSIRENDGQARRNALWPDLMWHSESREWPEGLRTIEWFVDVIFPEGANWTVFRQRWLSRLQGKHEEQALDACSGIDGRGT
jgi:hypothetical protein